MEGCFSLTRLNLRKLCNFQFELLPTSKAVSAFAHRVFSCRGGTCQAIVVEEYLVPKDSLAWSDSSFRSDEIQS